MVHAGGVAESAVQLDEWILRTDDLRETLIKAGYGSAFTSDDLFLSSRASSRRRQIQRRLELEAAARGGCGSE
jgi:hypothetical protein